MKHLLKKNGKLILISGCLIDLICAPLISLLTPHQVFAGPASEKMQDYKNFMTLVENGNIKPMIDRIFDYYNINEAYQYIEKRNKTGSVALKMIDPID